MLAVRPALAMLAALVACRPQPLEPTTPPPLAPRPLEPVVPPPPPAEPPPAPAPAPEPEPEPEPEPPPGPCTDLVRGAEQRKHPYVGLTLAELADQGGRVSCGRDALWQLHFGTICGDRASFHTVVTVALRAGRVHRVWQRKQYNAGFCGPPEH